MGQLRYDSYSDPIAIDDVELAQLKVVIGTKLRRQESFMMTWSPADPDSDTPRVCSAWIHPAIPLQFHFYVDPIPPVDAARVTQLMARLNATGDLHLTHLTPRGHAGDLQL